MSRHTNYQIREAVINLFEKEKASREIAAY